MEHEIRRLTDGITLLTGIEGECCIYLIEGERAALVVDTGLGTSDIRAEIEQLTRLPYRVVNTHGHGDHSGGDLYFDTVYMSCAAEADARGSLELNRTMLPEQAVKEVERRLASSGGFRAEYVRDGDVFDLGGRQLEVIEIPGHTPGCIALLDREDRVVFSGDCALKFMDILLVVPQALPVSAYLSSMKKLRGYGDCFDLLCTGHDTAPLPKSFLDEIIACCEKLLAGECRTQELELPPVFGNTHALRVQCSDFAVAYRPEKLF